jgi:ribonuclease D
MLQYGAQDTFFLPGLHEHLTRELQEKNRLSWHEECCRELVKATATKKEVDLENTWRIDGSSKLYPRQLAVLQALWKYRDAAAKAQDLPSYRILPSDLLLRFSLAVPAEGQPALLPNLPSRLNPKFKAGFLETLQAALDLPPESWPQPLKIPRRLNPSPSAAVLAHLKAVRDKVAKELGLDPSLLATKSTLTNVALTGANSRQKIINAANWMKWQEDLLLEPWLNRTPEKPEKSDKPEKADKAPAHRAVEKNPPAEPPEERKWGRR